MKTTARPGYQTVVDERTQLVLLYLQNTPFSAPGFTTRQVGEGTGLDDDQAEQTLQRLYTTKRVGRQKALWGPDQKSYWLPMAPVEPLELRGPPGGLADHVPAADLRLVCAACGRPTGSSNRLCKTCRMKGADVPAWADLDDTELMIMRLIDEVGDDGLSFEKTQRFGPEASRAIQSLKRRGICGVDLQHEVWRFGLRGRGICDDYKASRP